MQRLQASAEAAFAAEDRLVALLKREGLLRMTTRITQQQLESYLWGAAMLLRGTIDAGDYKQFIFPLLFYKRLCDVFDEETQTALAESGGDAEFRRLPGEPSLPDPARGPLARGAASRPKNVGRALQNAMRAIETANPDKLYGIFGDAQWTNKDRLSDAMLRDLIEHFSSLELTLANLPEDELGNGYEYLIKKFADDSGHTAAEFYTNRTVVHLMTEMLEPQPGESPSTTPPAAPAACCSPASPTCAGRARSGATSASTGRSAT